MRGLPTPFTVLTGVFGEGELGSVRQPRHGHWLALARLLLEAGAEPNDGQALYNRMFEPGQDHLELLFEFGFGHGSGGPWRARLGDVLDTPAERAAVTGHPRLVRYLVEHGARAPDLRPGQRLAAAALAADQAAIDELRAAHPGLAEEEPLASGNQPLATPEQG